MHAFRIVTVQSRLAGEGRGSYEEGIKETVGLKTGESMHQQQGHCPAEVWKQGLSRSDQDGSGWMWLLKQRKIR